MPRKGNGQSLKTYTATGWFGSKNQPGVTLQEFQVQASSLVGAIGRAARIGRKIIAKGRYTSATINVESV